LHQQGRGGRHEPGGRRGNRETNWGQFHLCQLRIRDGSKKGMSVSRCGWYTVVSVHVHLCVCVNAYMHMCVCTQCVDEVGRGKSRVFLCVHTTRREKCEHLRVCLLTLMSASVCLAGNYENGDGSWSH
jgi:hypothetical protein